MVSKFFGLAERQTSVKTEFIAGATTFLTMAYIIFVNPAVLSTTGMDKNALIATTCIVSAIATLITGIFGKAPIAMAPGMGLNAFFAYTLVLNNKINWETALGIVFLSGLLFLILTLFGLRKKLVEAIPGSLISAIAVGIGLFITFIGLVKLGIVVSNPATVVSAGKLTTTVLIGLCSLVVMIFLETKKIKGSLLAGIVFSTVLAWVSGYLQKPSQLISFDVNIKAVAFHLDIWAAMKWSLFGSIFSLMFMNMFDGIGTLVACCYEAKMIDKDNKIKGLDRLLTIDALAAMIGAVLGTSTTTSYIESAAGIEEGGRSGLTAVFTGIMLLAALLFVPVVGIVPEYATAPALIMVGSFMMKEVRKIDFANMEEAFPSFIIIVMIALSYSISTGLAFGFLSFSLIKLIAGKANQIKPAMWLIAVLSLLFLTMDRLGNVVEYFKTIK